MGVKIKKEDPIDVLTQYQIPSTLQGRPNFSRRNIARAWELGLLIMRTLKRGIIVTPPIEGRGLIAPPVGRMRNLMSPTDVTLDQWEVELLLCIASESNY